MHTVGGMGRRHGLARWLSAALLLAVGCFSTRAEPAADAGVRDGGAQDAGPGGDAGPERCRPAPVNEARWTETLLPGQAATATLRATEVSTCSCRPERVVGPGLALGLELCDCCDECDCIDPGYEGTARFEGLEEGDHTLALAGLFAPVPVTVAPQDRCFAGATVDVIRVDGPEPRFTAGPRAHWVRLEGTVATCCPGDRPKVAVRPAPGIPEVIALEVLHCDLCDLLCADPEPTRYVTGYPLLDLPVGEHRIVAGGEEATFEVGRF